VVDEETVELTMEEGEKAAEERLSSSSSSYKK